MRMEETATARADDITMADVGFSLATLAVGISSEDRMERIASKIMLLKMAQELAFLVRQTMDPGPVVEVIIVTRGW